MRASAVVNCQSALAWCLLRWSCHAVTSWARICLSAMRRSRHCDANAEFGFGHVEPAAVLGRVVPFEALDEPAGLGRGKGLIKRGWLVDVEIILHQHDFRRIWKMRIGQIPEHVGIIDGGVAVGDLDMPPAF